MAVQKIACYKTHPAIWIISRKKVVYACFQSSNGKPLESRIKSLYLDGTLKEGLKYKIKSVSLTHKGTNSSFNLEEVELIFMNDTAFTANVSEAWVTKAKIKEQARELLETSDTEVIKELKKLI